MKKTQIFALMIAISMGCAISAPAQAAPKCWLFGWSHKHWVHQDFQPYLEGARGPQVARPDGWTASDWLAQRDADPLVRGFYKADILREQTREGGTPVLVVGPNFYNLGATEKRQVVATIDNVYQITNARPNGMFLLRDWETGNAVGSYTAAGLQLQ